MKITSNLIPVLLMILVSTCNPSGNSTDVSAGSEKNESASGTVRLFAGNQRYLEFRGKPVVLITSAEHYGAVINMDFDYQIYLETLSEEGFNYTRIFGGTYIEPVDNIFGIEKNTLAPQPGRFMAPWEKSMGKYDLDRFNPAYFERLSGFLSEAEKKGIVVELSLFTSIYAENAWRLSPFNSINNRNGVGNIDFRRVNTLYNGPLKDYQERYIRKMVHELNRFNNLFFEIQNEPWSDNPNLTGYVNEKDSTVFTSNWQKRVEVANGASEQWQEWVASVIRDEESGLPKKHLISRNISNFMSNLDRLPEGVSIINFHYALPEAVTGNLDVGGVISLDETGFMPHTDQLYIEQAWRFILAGGGLYNNLDYSFTVGHESGDWPIPPGNPGWGGPAFREKLSYLVETINQVPFSDMEFSDSILLDGKQGSQQLGLAKTGESYLVLIEEYDPESLIPSVPEGEYVVTWRNIFSGQAAKQKMTLDGNTPLIPPFKADPVVILIQKSEPYKN